MRKRFLGGLAAVVLLVAGCGNNGPDSGDDFTGWQHVGGDYVFTQCDHGNRVYMSSNGDSGIAVVPHDPTCSNG